MCVCVRPANTEGQQKLFDLADAFINGERGYMEGAIGGACHSTSYRHDHQSAGCMGPAKYELYIYLCRPVVSEKSSSMSRDSRW